MDDNQDVIRYLNCMLESSKKIIYVEIALLLLLNNNNNWIFIVHDFNL
jgi:hypothetical protein